MKLVQKLFLMSTLFVAIAFLFGCGKYSLEDAKTQLEEDGYVVILVAEEDLKEYQEDDATITGVLTAQKGLNNVTIYTFKSSGDAKDFAKEAEKNANPLIKFYYVVSGNAVISSTNEAMAESLK